MFTSLGMRVNTMCWTGKHFKDLGKWFKICNWDFKNQVLGKNILKTFEINFEKKLICNQWFVGIEVYQILAVFLLPVPAWLSSSPAKAQLGGDYREETEA